MRFRSKERPRGILKPGIQQRVTLLIAGVGLIAIVISLTGRTGFWSALVNGSTAARSPAVTQGESGTRNAEVPPGALRGDEVFLGTAEDSGSVRSRSVLDQDEVRRLDRQARQVHRDPQSNQILTSPDLLRSVQDDVVGILSTEWEAYFGCLQAAVKLTAQDRENAIAGRYAVFMEFPDDCRGRAWTIQGTLRQLTEFRSRTDSFGTKNLYDAWISLPDSGSQLIHVVAAATDSQLAFSDEIPAVVPREVQLTGIFFKREGYARTGADGLGDIGLTPLLLAATIQPWQPPTMAVNNTELITPWLSWLALIVVGSVLGLLWQFQISDSIFRRTRTHQLTTLPVRVPFDDLEVVTISDTLRQMEVNSDTAESETTAGRES